VQPQTVVLLGQICLSQSSRWWTYSRLSRAKDSRISQRLRDIRYWRSVGKAEFSVKGLAMRISETWSNRELKEQLFFIFHCFWKSFDNETQRNRLNIQNVNIARWSIREQSNLRGNG
jgi:hypothetical protein